MEKETKKEASKDLAKVREKEAEREAILLAADAVKEESFDFDLDGKVELKNELDDMVLEGIDDPEMKYDLYYKAVNRLLRKHLPKGEKNRRAREIIYEEKNTFLTRGHRKRADGIRGADGRMAYIPDINELVGVVTSWITCKGSPFDLYVKLKELNSSKGY